MGKFTFQDSNLFQFKNSGNNSDWKRCSKTWPFLAESTARPENSPTLTLTSLKSKPVSCFTESSNWFKKRSEPRRMDCESCSQENPSGLLLVLEEEATMVGLLIRENFLLHLNGNVSKRGFEDNCIEFSCWGGGVVVRCIEKLREYEDNASVSALLLVGKTELSPVLVVGKTEWGFGVLLIFFI